MQFGGERLRPALDLLAQIPLENPSLIIDLGCGPGNVTALINARWPDARIIGVDSSEDMLAKAKLDHPDIEWQQADIANWAPEEQPDLIYSNACLHWLKDHDQLFPSLLSHLNTGGVLATQMPNNFAAPTHQLIAEILGENHPLVPGFPVHDVGDYYDWLVGESSHLNLWETTYQHILDGNNPVADWTRGAALRPILDGLSEKEAVRFEQLYREKILQAYPKAKDGKTVMPYKRFFLVAVK